MTPIEQFRSIAKPPPSALKRIGGGRLKGMTDIKPSWRIEAMTEIYGLCGVGWKFQIVRQWTEPAADGQVFAFVDVVLQVRVDDQWSNPIPGNGGSMLIQKEQHGLHCNDEAFKMATTDALSSAMKMIGMAHDVYMGRWDGSKYKDEPKPDDKKPPKLSAKDAREIENATADIAKATSLDELKAIGAALKERSPAVQIALRTVWGAKRDELEAKEKQNASS